MPFHFSDQILEVLTLLRYEFLVGLLEVSALLLVVKFLVNEVVHHGHVELVVLVKRSYQVLHLLLIHRIPHLHLLLKILLQLSDVFAHLAIHS